MALLATCAQAQKVELRLDQVEFLSERKLHVKGSVTAHGLMWPYEKQNQEILYCQLWVALDFMRVDGTWNVLADEARGRATELDVRNNEAPFAASAGYYHDGRKLAESTPRLGIPVSQLTIFDRELDTPRGAPGDASDDGRTFHFDETMEIPGAFRIPDQYRIIARLSRETSCYPVTGTNRFWTFYTYARWGPNAWETATPPADPVTGVSVLGVNGPNPNENPGMWKQLHGSTGGNATGGTGAQNAGGTAEPNPHTQADVQAARGAIEQALATDASLSDVQVAVTADDAAISTAPPKNIDPGRYPDKIAEIARIAATEASFTTEIRISFIGAEQHIEARMSQSDAAQYAAGTMDLQTFMGTWEVTSSTTGDPAADGTGPETPAQNTGGPQTPTQGGQTGAQGGAGTATPTLPDVPQTPAAGQNTGQTGANRATMAEQTLYNDLTQTLGLQNVDVEVGDQWVGVSASAPNLPSQALWSPFIAWIFADASLVAPWTTSIAVDLTGPDGITVPVEATRADAEAYVNGTTTLKQFMNTWKIAGSGAPPAGGQPTGGGQVPPGGPTPGGGSGAPGASTPAAPTTPTSGKTATDVLLNTGQLPQGWQASDPVQFSAADILATVAPGSGVSSVPVDSAAMQTLQLGNNAYTVVAMLSASNADAQTTLGKLSGGKTGPGLVAVSQNPPVHGMIIGQATYLISGAGPDIPRVGSIIGMAYSGAGGRTTPSTPQIPQAPQTPTQPGTQTPTQPQAPTTGQSQPMDLDPTSVVREAVICEGVDEHNDPVGVGQRFSPDTEKIALILRIEGAKPNTEVTLEWSRDGKLIARRILIVGGDQRLVTHIFPSKAQYLSSGNYAVEISEGQRVVGRRVFTIQ